MLLRPTTIFTIMSFLVLCEGIHSMSALLWFQPHWALNTHTQAHTHTSPQREKVFFSPPPFIAVWQDDLIPNVLYQDGPNLSIIKWVNIDFLQENHEIHPEMCGFIIWFKNFTELEFFCTCFDVQFLIIQVEYFTKPICIFLGKVAIYLIIFH